MSPQRLFAISLVHHINLDALARGDDSALLDFAASVLTWRHVSERLSVGQAEMQPQLGLLRRLVASFDADGCVRLQGQDYMLACQGVVIMDLLAAEADHATAIWAADCGSSEVRWKFPQLKRKIWTVCSV